MRLELSTLKSCFATMEIQGEFTSGTMAIGTDGHLGRLANVQAALNLDVRGFQQWATEVLALAL